jgi:hypothetical protein
LPGGCSGGIIRQIDARDITPIEDGGPHMPLLLALLALTVVFGPIAVTFIAPRQSRRRERLESVYSRYDRPAPREPRR